MDISIRSAILVSSNNPVWSDIALNPYIPVSLDNPSNLEILINSIRADPNIPVSPDIHASPVNICISPDIPHSRIVTVANLPLNDLSECSLNIQNVMRTTLQLIGNKYIVIDLPNL